MDFEDLEKMLNVFLRYSDKVIITRDIETDQRNFEIKDKFNYYDFKVDKFVNNNSKIILLDNIEELIYTVLLEIHQKLLPFME